MAWKYRIVGKSRDAEGRLAFDVEYRDTVSNLKQAGNQFVFERATSSKLAKAKIRAYGIVAAETKDIDDTLDAQLVLGDEGAL